MSHRVAVEYLLLYIRCLAQCKVILIELTKLTQWTMLLYIKLSYLNLPQALCWE